MLMCGYFSRMWLSIEVPIDPELRMMPALQEDLDAADRAQLIELLRRVCSSERT